MLALFNFIQTFVKSIAVLKQIVEHSTDKLLEGVRNKKRVRLIGDNLNFQEI